MSTKITYDRTEPSAYDAPAQSHEAFDVPAKKARSFDVKYTAIQMERGDSSSGLSRFHSEGTFMAWLREQVAERRAVTIVSIREI